ncbi:uncharacterized protein LOC116983788 isoform X2 [Amblyraja radiata]|uniref:uncharacterized protein LOC116983788 isoform X2 n=1 Tax=Amblyraja radiata TaxID=386614 RepID=UPI00140405E0|nr:uncharacterized protein LOC116983788 isoform X2 [Amblyraja radiata]
MNPFARNHDGRGIQGAFRKEDAPQDQGTATSINSGAASGQVFGGGRPAFASHASVPARAHARADTSERSGSAVNSGTRQHGPRGITDGFSPQRSNGQKKMALARVTPMPQDCRNLQQGPNALPATEVKSAQVRDAPTHRPSGSGQTAGPFSDAVSTSERNIENKIAPDPGKIIGWRNQHSRQILPHLPRQQNVLNIHFNYTPATAGEHCIVTSPLSSSGLKAQHNVTGPGIYLLAAGAGSKDPATSQLPPWSLGRGSLGTSSSGLDLVTQQNGAVPPVEVGGLCDQNVPTPSDLMRMLHSVFRLTVNDDGSQSLQMVSNPSVGLNGESCQPSSAQLPARDEGGRQSTAGLLLVIPPSMEVRDCQSQGGGTVYPPPPTPTREANGGSLNGNVGLVETSSIVKETLASMSELSKYSAASDANFRPVVGRHCKEMSNRGSSTAGSGGGQQQSCANSLPPFQGMSPSKDLSSLSELRGKKRNLTERTEMSPIDSAHRDPTFCDVRERLEVINSPPAKRFLASALEDASQDAPGCQNAVPPPNKEGANSPELMHGKPPDKGDTANEARPDVGGKEDICITGVFSLEDDTGQWELVQPPSPAPLGVDPVNPATGSASLAADQVNSLSAASGPLTSASILTDKTSPRHTFVMEEHWQTMDKSPTNLESRPCPLVTESPALIHTQPVVRSSTAGESSCDSSDVADISIDLTADEGYSSHPVLPSTLSEHNPKLVSDESLLPLDVNGQNPALSLDKETQDLDGLLCSIEVAIEALQDFWNPNLPSRADRLVCTDETLQGGSVVCKTPRVEERASSRCGVARAEDQTNRVDLLEDPNCGRSTDIKVLGHAEILSLLAEISSTNSKARLPVDVATPGPCTHSTVSVNEGMQNASRTESVESSAKLPELKECRSGGEWNSAALQGLGSRNGATKKGKHQKKIYCCINAWLVSSGVLGIYCNCKPSQGSKAESQAELAAARHKAQSGSERSGQNCAAVQKATSLTLNGVQLATRENALGKAMAGHAAPSTLPKHRWEGAPRKAWGVEAVPSGMMCRDVGARAAAERNFPRERGNVSPSGSGAAGGSGGLVAIVAPEGGLPRRTTEQSKGTSPAAAETGADKEDCNVALAKGLNEDKTQTVTWNAPSQNVLSEKASDRTEALPCHQHMVQLGFQVTTRKADGSHCWTPPKKRKIGVQDAKILPDYNCRILIRDKTFSSSGERVVLVNLLPLSGQPFKPKEKIRIKS